MDKLGVPVKGRIPAGEQLAEGRALARLTDLGYGGPLRELFAAGTPDAEVPPALARACLELASGAAYRMEYHGRRARTCALERWAGRRNEWSRRGRY